MIGVCAIDLGVRGDEVNFSNEVGCAETISLMIGVSGVVRSEIVIK